MIDLRDYGLKDSRAMNTDLFEIQKLWQLMNEHLYGINGKRAPNLVFVLQKELMMSQDQTTVSYFLRKASQTVESFPLTPAEMVQVYREEFGDIYPFELNGIYLLGTYSRGIFRRFLRYIQLCLDWKLSHTNENELIIKAVVGEVITEEEIRADWEMAMGQIFQHGDNWIYAVKVMQILYTASENAISLTQSELAQVIEFVSASDLYRIITKLEERGYVKRVQKGNGKIISVNS
jgi:hypothetical protein